MVINKIISKLMKDEKFTQKRMALAIGKTRPTDISSRLTTKNMSFDRAIEMLEVIGYEVVVQKKTQGVRGKDQIVVTRSDKE